MTTSNYDEVKVKAQKMADNHGLYYRIRKDYFGTFRANMVPKPRSQFGADRDGELVQPSTYREDDWSENGAKV